MTIDISSMGQCDATPTVKYDLAVGPIAEELKDFIVARALATIGERLGFGLHLNPDRPDEARDALERLQVPQSRGHAQLHLRKAAAALCAKPSPDADALAMLSAAWRHLSAAVGENNHSLIDLSQCCGGHMNLAASRRTSHAL